MNSSNFGNHSKTSAFKKFKQFFFFVKTYKNKPNSSSNRFCIKQFLILLYDCAPNLKQFLSIDVLLKNPSIIKSGTSKNPTSTLRSETIVKPTTPL